MKFAVVGDAIIQRRIQEDFEGYEELAPFIKESDASFFNLETTLNYEGECPASQFSGGTYIRTNPEVLEDLKRFGFNMVSANNNHAMDFSYEGLYRTLESLDESGLVHSGIGRNLAEASAPRYLDTKNGRVALIAVNTTFNDCMIAGEQTNRVQGRAGINGLRVSSYIELPQEDIDVIKRIAKETNINASRDIIRKEGYLPEMAENEAELGTMRFVAGDKARYVMEINEGDIQRVEKAIYEAKLQADYIMVSIHSHQLSGSEKENPSEFLQQFAHRMIDCGANAIVGHGPHLLRPIEIYKDCPIFYSLGDFIVQLYNIEFAPDEFYAKYGLSADKTVHELLKTRSKNFTVGLMTDERMFKTVIPIWETEGGKLKNLKLVPTMAMMEGNKSQIGLPRRCEPEMICEYLAKMSKPYGTDITIDDDGLLVCSW